MTSLNAVVVSIRLVIAALVQRLLFDMVGAEGLYKIGQLRSLTQLLTSLTSLGVFNGVVKYLAEFKDDKPKLQQLFSTTFVFVLVGTVLSSSLLFLFSTQISDYLFTDSVDYSFVVKLVAVLTPTIAMQRVFSGVVNGLSDYKKFAKIELISYLLSVALLIVCLLEYNLTGALLAIVFAPIIQVIVVLSIFYKLLNEYVQFSKLKFKIPFVKNLLAFTLMSFVATVLLHFVEIDIRSMLAEKLTEKDAGIWTNISFISKNYMVFSGALFSLYILPKFAGIYTGNAFKKEVLSIYKTLLPIFGLGMLVVFFGKSIIVHLLYPGLDEMLPLFKWQLSGDFIRLATMVLGYQFLAKKLVRNFIFSEIFSLVVFFALSKILVTTLGVEGVVIAHFLRSILVFFLILFLLYRYFKKNKSNTQTLVYEEDI